MTMGARESAPQDLFSCCKLFWYHSDNQKFLGQGKRCECDRYGGKMLGNTEENQSRSEMGFRERPCAAATNKGNECSACHNARSCPNVTTETLEEQRQTAQVQKTLDRWDVAAEYKGAMVEYFSKNPDALESITGNTNDCFRAHLPHEDGDHADLPSGVVIWHRDVSPSERETTTEITVGTHKIEIHPRCPTATATEVERHEWLSLACHEKAHKLTFKPKEKEGANGGSEKDAVDPNDTTTVVDPECWVAFTATAPRTHVWMDGVSIHLGPRVNMTVYPNGNCGEPTKEDEERRLNVTSISRRDICGQCGGDKQRPYPHAAASAALLPVPPRRSLDNDNDNDKDDLFAKYEPFEDIDFDDDDDFQSGKMMRKQDSSRKDGETAHFGLNVSVA